jgi:hypothetical protein
LCNKEKRETSQLGWDGKFDYQSIENIIDPSIIKKLRLLRESCLKHISAKKAEKTTYERTIEAVFGTSNP